MHSGEIVQQYIPQSENPILRRDSGDFSPPQNSDGISRKRRMSTVTDFGPYLVQQPLAAWNQQPQDTSRQLLQSTNGLVSPQTTLPRSLSLAESTTSPSSLQAPIWRDEPVHFRQQSSTTDDIGQAQISLKREVEIDNLTLETYVWDWYQYILY